MRGDSHRVIQGILDQIDNLDELLSQVVLYLQTGKECKAPVHAMQTLRQGPNAWALFKYSRDLDKETSHAAFLDNLDYAINESHSIDDIRRFECFTEYALQESVRKPRECRDRRHRANFAISSEPVWLSGA
jgi:hypothetical protein